MAKTSYISIPEGQQEQFYRSLNSGDRFTFSKINRKIALYSRKSKKGLSARSYLPAIAALWNNFSQGEKDVWVAAGAECGLKGYQLFVKDQAIRIKNDLSGVATPNLYNQAWAGYLYVEDPATEIKVAQLHPQSYWILKKVSGFKGMYEPVLVTENFALPLEISLNYKSDLTPVAGFPAVCGLAVCGVSICGDDAGLSYPAICGEAICGVSICGDEVDLLDFSAKFYARVAYFYQGIMRFSDIEIELDYQCDWKNATASLSSVIGQLVGYTLFFHLKGLRGTLFVDNVKAIHSSQNWVRDWTCNDMNQVFSRAFFQIPKHWFGVELPAGSDYGSTYPELF